QQPSAVGSHVCAARAHMGGGGGGGAGAASASSGAPASDEGCSASAGGGLSASARGGSVSVGAAFASMGAAPASTGGGPGSGTTKSCALRSSCPPFPRAYAIHFPSGECIGKRLEAPSGGTMTVGVPHLAFAHGMVASPAPLGASP